MMLRWYQSVYNVEALRIVASRLQSWKRNSDTRLYCLMGRSGADKLRLRGMDSFLTHNSFVLITLQLFLKILSKFRKLNIERNVYLFLTIKCQEQYLSQNSWFPNRKVRRYTCIPTQAHWKYLNYTRMWMNSHNTANSRVKSTQPPALTTSCVGTVSPRRPAAL